MSNTYIKKMGLLALAFIVATSTIVFAFSETQQEKTIKTIEKQITLNQQMYANFERERNQLRDEMQNREMDMIRIADQTADLRDVLSSFQ